jgi:hypothetical protein
VADNSGPFKLFWPQIDDVTSARAASRLGTWACILICIFTGGMITYQIARSAPAAAGPLYSGYIDSGIFALLALGIWRMWRSAAIVSLALFIIEQVLAGMRAHVMVGLVVPVLLTLFLISGVRGTFAFRRYSRKNELT